MKTITDLPGVFASAVNSKIRGESATRLDLAYIFVPNAASVVGVFTQNKFRAFSVDYSERCIRSQNVKAVIVNSGNANAATGDQGKRNVERMAELVAARLNLNPEQVAIAQTGIIGKQLPMEQIEIGIEALLKDKQRREGVLAADAILTTDLTRKEVFITQEIAGKTISIAGFTKGSGMIAPNMATMLGFIVTDAHLPYDIFCEMLRRACARSFNMISVDTDTSTNDLVLAFSTGEHQLNLQDQSILEELEILLTEACVDLAKQIARDGEGATKLIEVTVSGARTESDAQRIALSVVNSPLVKTAIHGADPNWGRVVMAVGKTNDVEVLTERLELYFGESLIFSNGTPCDFDRAFVRSYLERDTVVVSIKLNLGDAQATAWGCDLTKSYIDINTAYS